MSTREQQQVEVQFNLGFLPMVYDSTLVVARKQFEAAILNTKTYHSDTTWSFGAAELRKWIERS